MQNSKAGALLVALIAVAAGPLMAGMPQTITFHPPISQIYGAPPFLVLAQATSGLKVNIASLTPHVCRIADGLVTLFSTGICSLTAAQTGNRTYDPAVPVQQTLMVNPAKPSGALAAAPASPFAVGGNVYSVVSSDFNLDGIPDIASANGDSNNVTILLADGHGGFYSAPGSPFSAGSGPLALAAGDLNGDGIPDLAIANSAPAGLTILIGSARGAFAPPFTISLPQSSGPAAIALGDFNGDGYADVALADRVRSEFILLFGNGAGNFTAASGSPFALGRSYTGPTGIVVGDFNNDSFQDLAIVNQVSANIAVLLGTATGTFTPGSMGLLKTGAQPFSITVGDFDGDGNMDLATADNAGNSVTVLLGNGAGGFSSAPGSPISVPSPWSIMAGDINGDGSIDLVAGTASGLTLLLGNGHGTFTTTRGSSGAGSPISVALADFSQDGILDLATANYGAGTVSVLLGGMANTSVAVTSTSPGIVPPDSAIPLTATVSDAGIPLSTPTGVVTFRETSPVSGATVLGVAAQNTGPWTFLASGLIGGTHTFTASYSGDLYSRPSSGGNLTIHEGSRTPTVTNLSPVTWLPGGAAFTLTVNGTVFTQASQVRWNSTPLSTTYVSATQLKATVPAPVISSFSAAGISVVNPGVVLSAPLSYPAVVPTIGSLTPANWVVGGPNFTLTVSGTSFTPNSKVFWNDGALPTTFVSATQLTATVSTTLLPRPGPIQISAVTPFGAASNSMVYLAAPPSVTSLTPASTTATGPDFKLCVMGTGFDPGATVQWNTTALVTTFVSASKVCASVLASQIATVSTLFIGVLNSDGNSSFRIAFPVTPFVPITIGTLAPANWVVGGPNFTLTVNGTSFTPNSKVFWNDGALPTTFVSATQLTATVSTALLPRPGPIQISAVTPLGAASNSMVYLAAPPSVANLTPASTTATGPDFKLCVMGTGFGPGATIQWNTTALATTFVSASKVCGSVLASQIATVSTLLIGVLNSDGNSSFRISFPVTPFIPIITAGGVVPIYNSSPTVQPGSWASIYGANLATDTFVWQGDFPTSLGGASVTIDGKPAYLWSVAPTQINLEVPDDIATGVVKVVVTTPMGIANATVTVASASPSFSLFEGGRYPAAVITTPDGSGAYGQGTYDFLGPAGAFPFATRPARAGEILSFYGVGFGPTNPFVPAGAPFSGTAPSIVPASVSIGGVTAKVLYCGLVGAGLYQITVVVPKLTTGDQPLLATVGTVHTQSGVLIPVF